MLWILHRYQSKKEHAKIIKFFGDNEEFGKYAMMHDNDSASIFTDSDSKVNLPLTEKTDVVYLTTPDYLKSSSLSTSRSSPALPRSNNNSTTRFSIHNSNNNNNNS